MTDDDALLQRRAPWVGTLVVFAVALAFHSWLQFRTTGLVGTDGYYHVKLAHLYATGEASIIAREFRWMAFASIGELQADWQLGYHLFLVPFTWAGLILGGKLSAIFCAALLCAVVHGVLRAHRVPLAWVFALLLCAASSLYLSREHLVRPTTLLVSFLVLVAHLAATGRFRSLFACTLAMLFVYDVPHNALAVVGLAALAHVALDGRIPWRVLLAVVVAVVLGTVLHPAFWHWKGSFFGADHALFRVWSQMGAVLEAAKAGNVLVHDGATLGYPAPGEFRAPTGRMLVGDFVPALACLLGALLLLAFPARRKTSPFLFVSTGLALLYFWLFLSHLRFYEYWIPFAVLAAGAAFGRAVGDHPRELLASLRARPRLQVAAWTLLVVGPLAFVGWRAVGAVRGAAATIADEPGGGLRYEGAMTWLRENTEEGELVFHTKWPQFSPMFHFNHWNRYVIGLDPYFFFQHDPEAYRLWLRLGSGKLDPASASGLIRQMGARWVFARRNAELVSVLERARGTRVAFDDGTWVVLQLE